LKSLADIRDVLVTALVYKAVWFLWDVAWYDVIKPLAKWCLV
jgi:hypothetical protein